LTAPAVRRAGYGRGLVGLALTLFVAWLLPADARLLLLALILALTGGIYMGFAWIDGRPRWVLLESIAGVVLLAVALLGVVLHPLLIAAGFLVHILWDLLHHPRALDTRIARWVPPACLIYDAGVALAMFFWWAPL
jgi:hypothetical protein